MMTARARFLSILLFLVLPCFSLSPSASAQPSEGEVVSPPAEPRDDGQGTAAGQEAPAVAPPQETAQPSPDIPSGGTEPATTTLPDLSKLDPFKVRDPFWPVGYAPAAPEPVPTPGTSLPKPTAPPPKIEEPPKWDEALKALVVKGVMKAGPTSYVAIINGQVVGERDSVSAVFEGKMYHWKVKSISAKGASFVRLEVNE
jgi:hypothetical protein